METEAIKKKVTLTDLINFDSQKATVMEALMEKVNSIVEESKEEVTEVKSRGTSALCDGHIGAMKAVESNINKKRLEHGRIVTNFKSGNDDWYYEIIKPLTVEKNRLLVLQQAYYDKCRAEQIEQAKARDAEIAKRKAIQASHAEKGHKVDETPREELVPEVADVKEMTAAKVRVTWKANVVNVKAVLDAVVKGAGQAGLIHNLKIKEAIRQDAQLAVQAHITMLKRNHDKPNDDNMLVLPGIEVEKIESVL